MMMKYSIGFLVVISTLFTSCVLIKPVTVTGISNFKTVNPLLDPEWRFDIGLTNPNNYGVTLKKLEIGLSVDTPIIAKVSLLKGTKITRKESLFVPVALKPSMNELTNLFKSGVSDFLSGKKQQDLKVTGEIVISKFIFRKRYKISESIKF